MSKHENNKDTKHFLLYNCFFCFIQSMKKRQKNHFSAFPSLSFSMFENLCMILHFCCFMKMKTNKETLKLKIKTAIIILQVSGGINVIFIQSHQMKYHFS